MTLVRPDPLRVYEALRDAVHIRSPCSASIMKNAPVRHRTEYFFYRATKLGLLRLSHAGVRRFGTAVGRIANRVLAGQRRKALRNLELTLPELGAERHREVTRACFEHFGAYFCEIVSASRFSRDEILELFDIEGWEHVDAAEAAGRGYHFMCGHYGCWELAAYPLGIRLGRLVGVARPADNPFVDRDVARIRDRFGNVLIGKKGAGFRILNAARRGEHVAMVIDQKVRRSAGIRLPFLGQPAWTSPVLAFVSLHTRAPVIPIHCVPAAGGRYRFTIRPPIEPVAGRSDEAQKLMTRRYLEEVERDIRERPELWLWMHRRWEG